MRYLLLITVLVCSCGGPKKSSQASNVASQVNYFLNTMIAELQTLQRSDNPDSVLKKLNEDYTTLREFYYSRKATQWYFDSSKSGGIIDLRPFAKSEKKGKKPRYISKENNDKMMELDNFFSDYNSGVDVVAGIEDYFPDEPILSDPFPTDPVRDSSGPSLRRTFVPQDTVHKDISEVDTASSPPRVHPNPNPKQKEKDKNKQSRLTEVSNAPTIADSFHNWYTGLPYTEKKAFIIGVLKSYEEGKFTGSGDEPQIAYYAKKLKDYWQASAQNFKLCKVKCRFPANMKMGDDSTALIEVVNNCKDSIFYTSLDTSQYKGDYIKALSRVRIAVLNNTADSNFSFKCLKPANQPILPNDKVTWDYSIRALRAGDSLGVTTVIVTMLNIENTDEPYVVYSASHKISVVGSNVMDNVRETLAKNWLLITAITGLIGFAAAMYWKRKENTKKEEPAPKAIAKSKKRKGKNNEDIY